MRVLINIFPIILVFGCTKPVVKKGFDFSTIKSIGVLSIPDAPEVSGSGVAVKRIIIHQLMKNEINVLESFDIHSVDAILKCNILEFRDSRTIVFPVEYFDKGKTITTVERKRTTKIDSTFKKKKGRTGEVIVSRKTVHDLGGSKKTNELKYLEAVLGISIQLIDVKSNSIIWSSNYSYNSLDRTTAINKCVKGAFRNFKKTMNRNIAAR